MTSESNLTVVRHTSRGILESKMWEQVQDQADQVWRESISETESMVFREEDEEEDEGEDEEEK